MALLYDLFRTWDGEFLANMLRVGVPLAEKVLRPILVYVFLVFVLRIFGKRVLAQLNPFDLVVLLSLSNSVQNAIIGEDSSVTGGLIGGFTLCTINYLVVRFLFKHRQIDRFIEGRPTRLIVEGHVRHKALAKELMTENDLLIMAHRQGFAKLDEIETCIIEPGGTFFIQGKEPPEHERRHGAVLGQLEGLAREVAALRAELAAARRPAGALDDPPAAG
jgi:uncharacterized membrane protein YcaP (DUF421 family)